MEHSSKSGKKVFGPLAVRPLVVLILLLAISVPTAYSVMSSTIKVPSSGNVKVAGIGVYLESACTNPVTSISWGTLEPGSNITKVIYVKNTGNAPVTLSLGTSNWNPSSASSSISLSWDYGGQSVAVGQVIKATLTLSVSSSISGVSSFSFDIAVTASG